VTTRQIRISSMPLYFEAGLNAARNWVPVSEYYQNNADMYVNSPILSE